MAHQEQRDFVDKLRKRFSKYFEYKKVLDVGSLNINGTIRDFFHECNYIGLDVDVGNGVDIVCEGQKYNAPDDSYDVVCSAECFEHNPFWLETFKNMIRLCKNNGLLFFSCATEGRPEHGTTRTSPQDSPLTVGLGWDYYRNLIEEDFRKEMNFDLYFSEYGFEVNNQSHDLYFWGIVRKINQDSIPVIGVPIVNGVNWLKRLIDSIDYPVDELFIVNNSGKDEITDELNDIAKTKYDLIKNIRVCHLPSNIGCSGAWNLIIKCYSLSPYWIISNHDISFTPGLLNEMVNHASRKEVGVVKPGSQWELFLLKESVVQECGLFDENFYPAYLEDCDYYVRLLNKNILIQETEIRSIHGDGGDYSSSGSQTWRTDPSLKPKIDFCHNENAWYMTEKWGPKWRDVHWNMNPWKTPYNSEDIPVSYTKFDLGFWRKKHMGF